MRLSTKTIWIVCFALAMGYLEASVVVYLRELYYPEGFSFPMKEMSRTLALTELYREAATLIMILAVSVLAAEKRLHRFAWFLLIFAVWDLAYYLFLKIILDWPTSFLTTDILFLLPCIWTGPVIAPIINSLTMILIFTVILYKGKTYPPVVRLSKLIWTLLIAGTFIVLISYMKDFAVYAYEYNFSQPATGTIMDKDMLFLTTHFMPRSFNWLFFCTGVLMHISAVLLIIYNKEKSQAD
jgi:hypothetical protein